MRAAASERLWARDPPRLAAEFVAGKRGGNGQDTGDLLRHSEVQFRGGGDMEVPDGDRRAAARAAGDVVLESLRCMAVCGCTDSYAEDVSKLLLRRISFGLLGGEREPAPGSPFVGLEFWAASVRFLLPPLEAGGRLHQHKLDPK